MSNDATFGGLGWALSISKQALHITDLVKRKVVGIGFELRNNRARSKSPRIGFADPLAS
jgi:hypothetical protein